MSIYTAMYAGVSGLDTNGNSLNVIGDNIANVNTVGFKGARADFQDVLYQTVSAAGAVSQVGRGTTLSAVLGDFNQGSSETTASPSDLLIGGSGFFMVKQENRGMFYTRAGNFHFDKNGYMINPSGLKVQGWLLNPTTTEPTGAITDIKVPTQSSQPQATTGINMAVNLDSSVQIKMTPATLTSNPAVTSNFVFEAGKNDKLYANINGTDQEIDLVTANALNADTVYTGAQVASALSSQLNIAAGSTNGFTVSYDNATGHFNIANATGTSAVFHMDATTSTAANSLGFVKAGDTTASAATPAAGNTDVHYVIVSDTTSQKGNNSFNIKVDRNANTGGYVSVTLPDGAYSTDQMRQALETAINNAESASGEPGRVAVSYDDNLGVFQISSNTRGDNSFIQVTAGKTDFLRTINVTNYNEVSGANGTSAHGQTSSYTDIKDLYNITSGNNGLVFQIGSAATVSLSVAAGTYSGAALVTAIQNAAIAAGDPNLKVTYDDGTDRFTVSSLSASSTFTLNWTNSKSTLKDVLGFKGAADSTGTKSYVSDNGTAFNIVSGVNDSITVTIDNSTDNPKSPINVKVPAGTYTGVTMAAAIQNAINDAMKTANQPGKAVVTYSNNRFTVASSTFGPNSTMQVSGGTLPSLLRINDLTQKKGTGFDVTDPGNSSNFNTSITVYDSLGNQHTITEYFRKASDPDPTSGSNQAVWEWYAVVPASDSASGKDKIQANGTLVFDSHGSMTSESEVNYPLASRGFDFGGGSAVGQKIDINFGLRNKAGGTTQFREPSSTISESQDGYSSGVLTGVFVDTNGLVTGDFSNGQVLNLAKVALARFENPWGLFKASGNLYQETRTSGPAVSNEPGVGGLGTLTPNSLEISNVDMAGQFVKMITVQRGYQANSRVITTTDELLQEILNIKH
ncbi:MAG: flagellar hook-basal body complex protein [Deltaproteobacteria bacterium]|nr:flagellar hook-basal body complex protein [Deltaproteobacteria bacterium]